MSRAPYAHVELSRIDASISAKIRSEARRRGTAASNVRKQVVFTEFLGQLFAAPDAGWVLLGGTALLMREGGGRFTQDIDLATATVWESAEEVLSDLRHQLEHSPRITPFTFTINGPTASRERDADGYGTQTIRLRVAADLGRRFDTFSLDVTPRRHIDHPADPVTPAHPIEHRDLSALPQVATTPPECHLADKICALYERHHQNAPSTRYRDLADIVRLVQTQTFDAASLRTVLGHETARRRLELPHHCTSPDPAWEKAFPLAARDFAEYPQRTPTTAGIAHGRLPVPQPDPRWHRSGAVEPSRATLALGHPGGRRCPGTARLRGVRAISDTK